MVLKVATASLHFGHPSISQSLSAISFTCLKRRRFLVGDGRVTFPRFVDRSSRLYRSRSSDSPPGSRVMVLRRAASHSLASFNNEDFSKQIQHLALKFSDDERDDGGEVSIPERDEISAVNIERRANSVEIPFSLRMIRKKLQWQEGLIGAGESAYCSVKKAFSSMVFIFQELHSYSLQMRGSLLYEDLDGIMARVQKEMNASFVWLFQQVFSQTPSLMVYVMILLANYSVHSMASTAAISARPPVHSYTTEEVSVLEEKISAKRKFKSTTVKTLNLSSLNGKTTSVGGNNGGGGTYKPNASGANEDERFGKSNFSGTIVPDGVSSVDYSSFTNGEELVSMQENELILWNSFVEEASEIQDCPINEVLFDKLGFISPVDAKIEAEDKAAYLKTKMQYQAGLYHDPNNSLLLTNYAQFLHMVMQDFDRAEEYFKKATKVEPKDAEAFNKYGRFLWVVRNDIPGAEVVYQEAMEAEPENPHYQADYAHFLIETGGDETCYPLSSLESSV